MEICGAGNRDEFIGSEMLRGPNISDADPSSSWNAASQFELKNAEGYVEKMPAELSPVGLRIDPPGMAYSGSQAAMADL